MADSARHALFAVAESTYGTTPNTPAFKTIRHTGTTLALSKGSMLSEELRPDRQIQDFRHGNKQVGGDVSQEVSYGSLDDFLEAVLCGTWAAKAAPLTASTISTSSVDNSINDSGSNLPLVEAGDKITLSGFTAGAATNNQTVTVVSRTAAKIVVTSTPALVTQAAGAAYTLTPTTFRLKAGVQRRSFSLLRQFSDLQAADEPFYLYKGAEINTLALNVGVEQIVSAVFGFIGVDMPVPTQTAPAGSTFPAANTNPVMDSFSGSIKEGGTTIATVTEVTCNLENGIAPRFTVGSDAAQIRASIGRSNCTGQLTAYFENSALLKKYINQTETSIDLTIGDSAGNKLRFFWPRVKLNGGQNDTQGQGSITTSLPFQALLDSTLGTQLVIDRIPA